MKILKNIVKLLLISFVLINSFDVYGYGLVYRATFTIPNNSADKTIKILTMSQASAESKAEFNNSGKPKGTFIPPSAQDAANTGNFGSFSEYYYAFHPKEKPVITKYNSGFANNSESNNIYYDNSAGEITVNSYTFAGFSGIAANVPKRQNTNTSGSTIISKNSQYNKHLEWTISKGEVRLDINLLTNPAIDLLLEKYTKNELMNGVRFSNGLRTTDNRLPSSRSNMDTTWLYFQNTVGVWNSGGRGFNEKEVWSANGTGTHNRGASVANEFDNILIIPFDEKNDAARKIYINHVDERGNVISGLKKNYQEIIRKGSVSTIYSSGGAYNYQESYGIINGEQLKVTENTTLTSGNKTYEFLYEKDARSPVIANNVGAAVSQATSNLRRVTQTSGTPKQFPCPSDPDVVVVNLVYREKPSIPSGGVLPKLQLVGRLEFINKYGDEYSSSTTGPNIDYSPSTGRLTPYAQGAYPYIVRALKYKKDEKEGSVSATSTAHITYNYNTWTYEHGNATELGCGKKEHEHSKKCYDKKGKLKCKRGHSHTQSCYKHKHDSTCDWYESTGNGAKNKRFNYTVKYKRKWYKIENFKMYRIDRMEVYDNDTNTGGTLFGGGKYIVKPSRNYEEIFFNDSMPREKFGHRKADFNINFESRDYNLNEITKKLNKPYNSYSYKTGDKKSSQYEALKLAEGEINKENHKTAAAAHSNATINEPLTITFEYENEYIFLDGKTDMLQENKKSWSQHIEKENDSYKILDATKKGDGRNNSDKWASTINYTSNLMSYMKPTDRLTTSLDFDPNYQKIPWNRENGIRSLQAKIYYTKVNDSRYNVGSDSFKSTDATYRLNNNINVSYLDFTDKEKLYKDDDVNKVNVLTPISFGNFDLITTEKVDHSTGAGNATILQKNAEFSITPTTSGSSTAGYSYTDTRNFVKGYYYLFDFNIVYQGREIAAFTPIYIEGAKSSLYAKTTDSFSSSAADQKTNSIKIVAVTINITDALKSFFDKATYPVYSYMDSNNNVVRNNNVQNQSNLLTRNDIVSDAYHAIYKVITTKNIGRIFDFAVTDCTDIAFKDVFRKNNSSNVNMSTGKSYYSGYKKWNLYSSEYNEMINRDDIGTSPQTILPLGPYKHTSGQYINAPKMGYRISFDLKTTGYMMANNKENSRRVEIIPSYYYISKDGKTFDNNINLYYKNSSNKYINFATSGYTIYYKPNDGYRYLRNSIYTDDYTSMSTKLEPLTISNKLILTNKMMSTNNTSFIQAWYGEFKLPNSTIAVSKNTNSVNSNINNPYKDGYIGVIFDIKSIDNNGFALSYNTNDKSASKTNTSQWDYEGFMNFKNPGSVVNGKLKYQLEKDIWNIDNTIYNKIKGTVVLFDTDNRAANDFE